MNKQFIRIYDFDGTIYDGNSTVDFFFFFMSRHPSTWIKIPWLSILYLLFWSGLISLTTFLEEIFHIFRNSKKIEQDVELFWKKNRTKIRGFYRGTQHPNDIIISASPEFLLCYICKELGVGTIIASKYDIKKGKFIGNLCFGIDKQRRLNALGIYRCDELYTDVLKDAPIVKMADIAFLVDNKRFTLIWKK